MKIKIRSNLSKENVVTTLFTKFESPYINIFGKGPNYTVTVREDDGNRLIHPNMTEKLKQHNLEITIPPDIKAQRSILIRKVPEFVGRHSASELKTELQAQQDWLQIREVTKIKDYTHLFKVECTDVRTATKILEQGLLLFGCYLPPNNMTRDEFVSIQTCFVCYQMESHSTLNCPSKNKVICSECSSTEHRWQECTNREKKCINCDGPHRTLAMACPIKKELINKRRQMNQQKEKDKQTKTYRDVLNDALKEIHPKQPAKTELGLQHDFSFKILTTCILAHLHNIAEPGTFNKHLNVLLKKNNLPPFNANDDEPSEKIFDIASLNRQVTTSQESLNLLLESDDLTQITTDVQPAKEQEMVTETMATVKPPIMSKPTLILPAKIPASTLGLKVFTTTDNPYPKSLTHTFINDGITQDRYKYTYTTKTKTDLEILELIATNNIIYAEPDLTIVDPSSYRKIRNGNAERSPAPQRPDPRKRSQKPWAKTSS